MIITTIEELRRCLPSHAIDHIEAFKGYIDNSEHEFLLQPLGQPLYDRLCDWYDENQPNYSEVEDRDTGYWNRLLLIAQRCVAFDAMSRAIDQQAISINGAGINFASADDYKPADRDAINAAKLSYQKEAHSALNRLLYTLEQWCISGTAQPNGSDPNVASQSDASSGSDPSDTSAQASAQPDAPLGSGPDSASASDAPSAPDPSSAISHQTSDIDERTEITALWRQSRYFYLVAQLLIPSAVVLQEYLNIYDSREKYIQMLPDLHFIQEEQIAPAIGEDFCDYLVGQQLRGGTRRDLTAATAAQPKTAEGDTLPATVRRLLHKLRKIEATLLEGRTKVLRVEKDRRIAARDEGMRLLSDWLTWCQQHQTAILRDLDTLHGLPPTAAALLSPADREQMQEDVLQACLEAERPFTDSPMFLAPVFAEESEGQVIDSSQRNQATCPHDSQIDGMLVTPPLL